MLAKSLSTSLLSANVASDLSTMNSTAKQVNDLAPVLCSKTILIDAKPEKVWAVLTDIDNWSKWLITVTRSKLNGPLLPNTTFDWKSGGMSIHSTLHTVTPFSILGWTGKVYGIYAIHNWSFKEVNGGTEVAVSESMEGLLATLFKKSFNKIVEKDMVQSLKLLKTACEK